MNRMLAVLLLVPSSSAYALCLPFAEDPTKLLVRVEQCAAEKLRGEILQASDSSLVGTMQQLRIATAAEAVCRVAVKDTVLRITVRRECCDIAGHECFYGTIDGLTAIAQPQV